MYNENRRRHLNLSMNPSRKRGRTTSEFFEQFKTIQDRFNTRNLNDFMRVYKSQEGSKKKKEFKYDYDAMIGKMGEIDPKGQFKLDTVKNTINAPDPKSSFFRTKDNHFVRKDSRNFFIDERLRKRNKEIISKNKLLNIINRENNLLNQKENHYIKNEKFMELKRKRNAENGKIKLINLTVKISID